MKWITIPVLILGLSIVGLGLCGGAQMASRQSLIICTIHDVRVSSQGNTADIDRLEAQAKLVFSDGARYYGMIVKVGWVVAAFGFFGSMIRRKTKEGSVQPAH